MAKKKDEKIEEQLITVKANVCLKYNSKYIEIGEKFKVNEKDFEELEKRKLVEKSK